MTSGFFTAFAQEKTPSEEKFYEVDIILFAVKGNGENDENWPDRIEFPSFNKSQELVTPYEQLIQGEALEGVNYVLEPMNQMPNDLSEIASKLNEQDNYELIFRKIWRQPMKSVKQTRSVFVSDTNKEYLFQSTDPELEKQMDLNSIEPEPSPEEQLLQQLLNEEKLLNQPVQAQADFISDVDPIEPFELMEIPEFVPVKIDQDIGPPQHKVFGLVKVFKARFPHLSFNLFYREPELMMETEKSTEEMFPMANETESNASPMVNNEAEVLVDSSTIPENEILGQEKPPHLGYQLKISTRIRLNEIHYFDHPKFGVISRVRLYEPPEEEEITVDIE